VEILWPMGNAEVLSDLASDHLYVVKEGKGIVPAERGRSVAPKD
jgi:hypothetical protein